MGVVYKAEDTRLHRGVALKFLPETHFDDPAARERFEREAQAASALNHPHICTVYDIGEHEGRPFIVMECLHGQTLKHRIAAGRFSTEEILDLGLQVADALDAAHGNRPPRREAGKHLRHRARPGQGARLRPRDAEREGGIGPGRRDGDALGVVLYEMATGALPFGGATSAAIFDAILNKTPTSVLRLNPELPNELERIISKCLEKDPDLRYQSARDLMADLKRLWRDTTSGQSAVQPAAVAGAGRAGRLSPLLWVGAGALVLAAAVGWWTLRGRAPQAPARPITITPFTTDGGGKFSPRLSPDGEKVAHAWAGPDDDNWDIYVKVLGPGTKPLRITEDPATDWSPTWSPDGRQIAFVRMSGDKTAAISTTRNPSCPESGVCPSRAETRRKS